MVPSCPGPRDLTAQILDLGLYLDGALPDGDSRAVEVHLSDCEACRQRLKELRDIKSTLEDRALWRGRGSGDTGLGVGTSCLSAAEMLLALEGKAPARAEAHLGSCEGCTHDVLAIEESTEEHAAGRCKAEPELLEVLRAVGKPSSDDLLAPIILAPIPTPESGEVPVAGSKRARRLAPRHPSKRMTAADVSGRRRTGKPRQVTVAGGMFTFAAAAAAAVIVGLILSSSGPPPVGPEGSGGEPRQTANANTNKPEPVKPAVPQVNPKPNDTPRPAPEEQVDPPAPESPFLLDERQAEPSAPETPAPHPGTPETPAPAPSSEKPVVASQPGTSVPKSPLPLDAPAVDDGARLSLDLSRLSGGLAIQQLHATDADKWARLARKDGQLSLKPGDRLRSTQGAFLSLDSGTYELSLAPKSELVVRAAAHGPVLGLTDGRVLCEVEKLPADKHLVVATNAGDFECTGTVFSVAADSRKALCSVQEGTVVCHGQTGEPQALGAGYALTVSRGAAAGEPKPMTASDADGWARSVRPEREVIYAATFDRGELDGFTGETTDLGAFRGVGRSLLFQPIDAKTSPFWGIAARAPKGHIKSFKPTLDMRIEFSVWLEKSSKVLLQVLNDRQTKYFKRDFGVQPAERWVTLTVPVMDLEAYFDPGKSPMREADLLSEIEVFAGKPGEQWKALLDDVIVYRKHYR